ncbi:MAG: hypothetical protein OXU61_13795, partial [Gammaproteobacteria bacterium]|nr:hypothetical protein [Gammaproteobacteria bacterium]
MSSERDTLPAAAGKVAGRARRRAVWGLALAAGLAAAPSAGWAQTLTVNLGADQTVNEGDTVILAATASGSDPITTWLLLTQTTGPTPSYSWSIA